MLRNWIFGIFIFLFSMASAVASYKYEIKCNSTPSFTGKPVDCLITIWPVNQQFFKNPLITIEGGYFLNEIKFSPSDENHEAAIAKVVMVFNREDIELIVNGEMIDGKNNIDVKALKRLEMIKEPFIFSERYRINYRFIFFLIVIVSFFGSLVVYSVRRANIKISKKVPNDFFDLHIRSKFGYSRELREQFNERYIKSDLEYKSSKKSM